MSKTYEGTVARFMTAYGFIYSTDLRRKVFFHVSNFNRATDPVIGESVTFDLAPSQKPGMADAAVNVNPVAEVK